VLNIFFSQHPIIQAAWAMINGGKACRNAARTRQARSSRTPGFHSSWMFKIVLIAGKLAVVVLVVQSLLAK
jgi:hypothetical protein